MHKIRCKEALIKRGLPTPEYLFPKNIEEITMSAPLVVKAADQGSSIGVAIIKDQSEVLESYQKLAGEFNDVFLEKYIAGAEVTVGVMSDGDKLFAMPILELRPKNAFYDFESKYTPGGTEFILPANLPPAVTSNVQELAKQAYLALGCAGAVRVDFVLEDRRKPYILEINTNPGMTDQSDLPAEAKAMGINFEDLVEKILLTAKLGKD